MGIGDDIKEVLAEVATPFSIQRMNKEIIHTLSSSPDTEIVVDSDVVSIELSGEYMDVEAVDPTATSVFGRLSYFASLQYDTQVVFGDLISIDDMSFLVLDIKKNRFEGESVELLAFLLEVNSMGMFSRQSSGVRNPQTYQLENVFLPIFRNVKAAQVEKEAELEISKYADQTIAMNSFNLYCQQYEIREGDRWYPNQNDLSFYLIVTAVNKNQFKNMIVCTLEEDSR